MMSIYICAKFASVTERARKLRAQYALQAQSLRTRIELRINRIPSSLRKANMGELYEKYIESANAKQNPMSEEPKPVENEDAKASAQKVSSAKIEMGETAAPSLRGVKRNR